MTIVHPDNSTSELPDSSLVAQAYRALSTAAERMGRNGYVEHMASKYRKRPFTPSSEHVAVMDAMPALLDGRITPDEAMGLLHGYDFVKQRTN